MTYTVQSRPNETIRVAESTADTTRNRVRALEVFEERPEMRTLMRAFASVLLGQINLLRSKHALPALTMADVRAALVAEIQSGRWD